MSTATLSPALGTAAAPLPRAAASPWLFGPRVDLLVGCGLWTLPILALTAGLSAASFVAVAVGFHVLSLFCNYPHYMATIYRAYGTAEDFARYRFFTIYCTAILVGVALFAHWKTALVPLLFTVYITWSPWHYTGQNFGLSLMFARRAGVQPPRAARNVLQWAFLGSYLTMVLGMHTGAPADGFLLSAELAPALSYPVRLAAMLLFFAGVGYALPRMAAAAGGWRPLAPMLVLVGTQFLWFVAPVMFDLLLGMAPPPVFFTTGALAFMHCAQYLWVTTYYARREAESGLRGGGRWSPGAYGAILVLGGLALFLPGPWLASRAFGVELTQSLLIFVSLINIHHFMVDGVIWKLRDGRIAQLLLGRREDAATAAAPGGGVRVDAALTRLGRAIMSPAAPARLARWGAVAAMVSLALVDTTQMVLTTGVRGFDGAGLALRINPYDSRALVARAGDLAARGRDGEALVLLRRALELNDRNVAALRLMGSLLVRGGFTEEAWDHYRRVEARVLPDVPTLVDIGHLAVARGDLAEAERRLLNALERDSSRRDVLLALGEMYLEAGRIDEAVGAFGEYLLATPVEEARDPASRRRYLAVALRVAEGRVALGRIPEAADTLREVGELAINVQEWDVASKAFALLATLLEQADRRAEALQYSQLAVSLASRSANPDDVGLQWLALARFLGRGGWSDEHTYLAYLSAERRLAATSRAADLLEAREGARALAARLGDGPARAVRDRADALRVALLEWTPDALRAAPGATPAPAAAP